MAKKTHLYEDDWPDRESWSAGSVWLGYTMFYGFMPLWLGVLAGLGFSNQRIRWTDFLIHGELLIYAASLTAYSTRLIASDVNTTRPFASRQVFNLISHAVIIPSAAAYAIVMVLTFSHLTAQISASFMSWFSVPMVLYSIFFSLVVFVEDHRRTTTPLNVAAEYKKEEEQLSVDFDQLERAEVLPPQDESQPSRGDENG
jgi:hypothetical protein